MDSLLNPQRPPQQECEVSSDVTIQSGMPSVILTLESSDVPHPVRFPDHRLLMQKEIIVLLFIQHNTSSLSRIINRNYIHHFCVSLCIDPCLHLCNETFRRRKF